MGEYPTSKVISLPVYSSTACLLCIILLRSFRCSILSAAFILQKLEETSENRIPCDRYFRWQCRWQSRWAGDQAQVFRVTCVQAPLCFFHILLCISDSHHSVTGQSNPVKKKVKAFAKYDRCLYKGLCVLVSTAKCMCTLITQDTASKFSAFSTCITRKFKHHHISHMCEKKTYQSNQNP